MKPLLVTSGEPAGIGPDLCLSLVNSPTPLVVLCHKETLVARAIQLGLRIRFLDYESRSPVTPKPNQLTVLSIPCSDEVVPGVLNAKNATYVMNMLTIATQRCLQGEFSALVTAPVNKAILNTAGYSFTGHTEFLAACCGAPTVVMMLVCQSMRVALVTTHLPLREVADTITKPLLYNVVLQLHESLRVFFGIDKPRIDVAGLNPHAGEAGYLGREELDVIAPVLVSLQKQGLDVRGPFPADTLFSVERTADAFLAMYHDQGLPVLKYAGFGQAVNVTLGLPIIRVSVDHGTALELAGTGLAKSSSLKAAVEMAASMASMSRGVFV